MGHQFGKHRRARWCIFTVPMAPNSTGPTFLALVNPLVRTKNGIIPPQSTIPCYMRKKGSSAAASPKTFMPSIWETITVKRSWLTMLTIVKLPTVPIEVPKNANAILGQILSLHRNLVPPMDVQSKGLLRLSSRRIPLFTTMRGFGHIAMIPVQDHRCIPVLPF